MPVWCRFRKSKKILSFVYSGKLSRLSDTLAIHPISLLLFLNTVQESILFSFGNAICFILYSMHSLNSITIAHSMLLSCWSKMTNFIDKTCFLMWFQGLYHYRTLWAIRNFRWWVGSAARCRSGQTPGSFMFLLLLHNAPCLVGGYLSCTCMHRELSLINFFDDLVIGYQVA